MTNQMRQWQRRVLLPRRLVRSWSTWLLTLSPFFGIGAVSAAFAGEQGRPSEALDKECQTVEGVVKVCAINRWGRNIPQLELSYSGILTPSEDQRLVAFVRLNGESGFFHMKDSSQAVARLFVGRPVQEFLCIVKNIDETLPTCPASTNGLPGTVRWHVEPAPDAELILFETVFEPDGKPRPWNLELAFVSEDGRNWDSRYGRNYRFFFDVLEIPPTD